MRKQGLIRVLLVALAPVLYAAESPVSWLPDGTTAQRDARMAWWRDAKFGMFIHWGLYSLPADGEWHMRNKKMPFAEYSKFAAQFNPINFNADEWMSLACDAGMKYVVITTRWRNEQPTGWLEIDAGKPVAVPTLRISAAYCNIKNCALEYKAGDGWKPKLTGEKLGGDCVVKNFLPVTAQVFRMKILKSDKPPQICNLELYPPL